MTLQLRDIKNLLDEALLKQKVEIFGEINDKIDMISKDLLKTKLMLTQSLPWQMKIKLIKFRK